MSLCPQSLIESHNEQDGLTVLINGSMIIWLHLDKVDTNSLRGLEGNSILVDQPEELDEKIFWVLDARLGRWSGAVVPKELLDQYREANGKEWPKNSLTGKHVVPSYHMLLPNPDSLFHWIYRKFHPDSIERDPGFFYVEGEWVPELGSVESYNEALKKDVEYVDKYVRGKWGASDAAIHTPRKESYLEYSPDLINAIKDRGRLIRVMDHGDSAPTCCLWWAAIWGVYICYREYYMPGKVVSVHRQNIFDLTQGEEISVSYADPQIFKKTNQKDGGFWSIADEYLTGDIDAPALHWLPADNNEFATRNRINELLVPSPRFKHPITGNQGAPGLYFIQQSEQYPYGCRESIRQLGSQRKKALAVIEGKTIYSDERDESITDHAYDCVRYFVAMHSAQPAKERRKPARNSFAYYDAIKQYRSYQAAIAGSAA